MPSFSRFLTLAAAGVATLLILLDRVLAQDDGGNLKAGAAAVDISPTVKPFQLRSGKSEHVHDPLHVRAVAFENGEGRAVIALIDAIGTGRDDTDEAKRVASEKTGWRPEQMMISATHTHSAPKGGDTSPGRIAYDKLRRDGMAQALIQAIESIQPAEVGFASDVESSEVYNRRWYLKPGTMDPNPLGGLDQVRTNAPRQNLEKPAGPTDPEVPVIYARSSRGKPIGLIANYALHYVGGIPKVKEENGRVVGMASADYYGEFARIMPYRVGGYNPPEGFVAFITNGASGDINNIDFHQTRPPREPFEQCRIVARKTADAAWRAVKKIEDYDQQPVIATLQREVALEYRRPSQKEIEMAMKMLKLPRNEREEINKRASSVSTRVVEFSGPDRPEPMLVLIQAFRIGDQAVVSLPFEVFVEIGLEIKEKSPFPHTILVELANGSHGYLPTPEQHELGGYETWIGVARFQKEASEILMENLLEMLRELWAK
tara:strand:+ start:215 stop:1678 length:1464 start_codon:yes stop_codon:yes gene_type:complete